MTEPSWYSLRDCHFSWIEHGNAEMAMNWVLEHEGDADFNDPLPGPAKAPVNEAYVSVLTSLGFSAREAEAALVATGGDPERGADWLFSHADNLAAAVAEVRPN